MLELPLEQSISMYDTMDAINIGLLTGSVEKESEVPKVRIIST